MTFDSIITMMADAVLKARHGTPTTIRVLKSRPNQNLSGLQFSSVYCDDFVVPNMMQLRDLFVTDEVSLPNGFVEKYSFPAQDIIKSRVFDTFEPITSSGCPEWAAHYFKFRNKDNPAMVPLTFLTTWFEGRWAGRVNTNTFPVTVSLWFESPEDVVLAKLAGLPLSEKHVVLSERS